MAKAVCELLPDCPNNVGWAIKTATQAADALEATGVFMNLELDVPPRYTEAIKLLEEIAQSGIEKNGMAGKVYVINEVVYSKLLEYLSNES